METLEIVSDPLQFKALEEEWNALAHSFATPLVQFDWFNACRQFVGKDADLRVFVIRDGHVARAIAPMIVNREWGLARLTSLSHATNEPNGFIYADQGSLVSLCKKIASIGRPVVLPRFNSDSAVIPEFRQAANGKGLVVIRTRHAGSSRVPLDIGWETLLSRMSSTSRTSMRRSRKIAERYGPVTFAAISTGEDDVDRYLDEAFRVEALSWKSRSSTAVLQQPIHNRFLREYAHATSRKGFFRFFSLNIGDEMAAAGLAVEYAGQLWGLKIGYDERFSKCAPGILLKHEILQYACEQKLEAFEFLGETETWHRRWPIEPCHFTTLYFYPLSITGLVMLSHDCLRYVVHRVRRVRSALVAPA